MRVALRAWHTPYIWLMAKAMPEVTFYTCPTPYCPRGWNELHRPLPSNVIPCMGKLPAPDVVICQTEQDFDYLPSSRDDGPALIYLGHNLPRFESPSFIDRLNFIAGGSSGASVSISPMKAVVWQEAVPGDKWHTILPGIPLDEFSEPWTGEGGYVLTVCNGLSRPLFDLPAWLEATRGLPVKLVGSGNEGIPGAVGPAKDWEELKRYYREARCYLSVNKWPNEDGHNLALLEAMATGTPSVCLSNPTMASGATGGARAENLSYWLRRHLSDRELAEHGSQKARESVGEQFPLTTFRQKWLAVLESVTV